MIVRLLATDGRIWDLDISDYEMLQVRVVQFQGMTFLGFWDDFRDNKWLRLFRQTKVKFLRGLNEKSLEEKRQEYLDRAAKQLEDAYERGRESAKRERPDSLTYPQIEQACKNIGFPIECGACASLFYTGTATGLHTCGGSGS